MAIPLKVLLVEDSDDDAFLLTRELRRGNYEPDITRVADAEGMRAALAGQAFDIVLADYYMPRFSGQAALELALELAPETPLIVVSATIGEETAVAMVKAGARDYVMKGKLNRLAPAIERARREVEARRERLRAEQALRVSEEKFRSTIEQSADGILLIDTDLKISEWSRGLEVISGYSRAEMLGQYSWDAQFRLLPGVRRTPEHLAMLRRGTESLRQDPYHIAQTSSEVTIETRTGAVRHLQVVAYPIQTSTGTMFGSIMRDITEHRRAERALRDSEEKFRSLIENALDVITVADTSSKVVYESPSVERVFGYRPDELIGTTGFSRVHPDDVARVAKVWQEAVAHPGETRQVECRQQHKDGSWRDIEALGRVIVDPSGQKLFIVNARDITERRRVEQALRDSEEKFRSLIENALDIISVNDSDGKVVYESPAVERLLGYGPSETAGSGSFSRLHPDDAAAMQALWAEAARNLGQTMRAECRLRHQDGSWRTVEALGRATLDASGKLQFIVNARDISDRRQAELALRASEEKFRSLVENTVDVISVRDASGRVIFESPSAESVFGYKPDELVGRTGFDRIHPDDLDRVMGQWHQALANPGKAYRMECRMRHRDGSWLAIEAIGLGVRDSSGQMQILTNVRDATERQRADAAVRESEEKFRGFIEQSNDGVIILDADMRIVEWSRGQQEIFGFTRDEMVGRPGWEYQYMVLPEAERTPELLERLKSNLDHISREQPPHELMRPREVAVQTKNGAVKYVQVSAFPIRTPSGMRFGSITRDVTQRRQAEAALHESEEKFRRFVEQSTDGIVILDQQMCITEWSRGQEIIFGYSRADMLGQPVWDYQYLCLPREQRTEAERARLERALRALQASAAPPVAIHDMVLEVETKSGERRFVQVAAFPIRTAGGTIFGSIARDVTDRRRAEQALSKSEQQLRGITDNMLDMISVTDVEGRFTYVSPSTTKVLGYAAEELLGHDFLARVHPEDQSRVLELATQAVAAKTQGTLEYRYFHADGHEVWLESVGNVIVDEAGNAVGAVFGTREVTDRHRAEQALRDREEFYRSLIENTLDLIVEFNMDGRLSYVSPSVERVFGYRTEDVVGRNLSQLGFDPVDLERITSDLLVSPPHEIEGRRFEVRIRHRDGSWRWIEALVRIVPQLDRDPRFVVNARDISARRESEQALRSSEEKYRRLVESLGREYFFYRHDTAGVFTYLSPSVASMLGYSPQEFSTHYTRYLTDSPLNLAVVAHTDGSLRGEQQPPYEVEILHQDGSTRSLEVTEVPLRGPDGGVIGVEGIAHDVTARKQTEQTVKQTRDLLDQIVDAISEPVFVKDRQHRFALVNDAMVEFLGIAREEWIGASDADFFPPEQVAVFLEKDEQVFVTGEPNTNEERLTGADGRVRTIITKKSRLIDAAGNAYIVGVIHDVTVQRELERTVRAQAESTPAI